MAGWIGTDRYHVMPVDDLVEHDEREDCCCGPTPELVPTAAGDAWLYTHHSLDGREAHETPTKENR